MWCHVWICLWCMWGTICRGDREISSGWSWWTCKVHRETDSKSALSNHQEQSWHRWNYNPIIHKIKVLDKELSDLHWKVLEAVHIKLRRAALNWNSVYYLLELYLPLLREDIWGGGGACHPPLNSSALRPWPFLGQCLIPGWWLTDGNLNIGGNQFIIAVVGSI